MPIEKFHIAPDPEVLKLRRALDGQLRAIALSIAAGDFPTVLDPQMKQLLEFGFARAHADQGAVWLADPKQKFLVPVYETENARKKFVGKFKQPLSEGIISMVFATERPFVENEVHLNAGHSKKLDKLLHVTTYAMIATPLYFMHGCRGILSGVQLMTPESKRTLPGFSPEDIDILQHVSTVLGRLIEHRTVSAALGWLRI